MAFCNNERVSEKFSAVKASVVYFSLSRCKHFSLSTLTIMKTHITTFVTQYGLHTSGLSIPNTKVWAIKVLPKLSSSGNGRVNTFPKK